MSEMVERVARAMAERCKRSHDWPFWLDEASAAIEAMREPTKAMERAFLFCPGEESPHRCTAKDAWHAMIDEALK